jgi:nucleoside-diphosphate-sugar epimerase
MNRRNVASVWTARPGTTTAHDTLRLLITGAAGEVAQMVVPSLEQRYQVHLTDRRAPTRPTRSPFHAADITDPAALQSIVHNIDIVVHLAAHGQRAEWSQLWPGNIVGFHNVLSAAATANCQRVVFASTIQTMDGYPVGACVPTTAPPRPINPYGLSKVIGETLAYRFAADSELSVLCIRLGWVLPLTSRQLYRGAGDLERVITADDLVRLLRATIEARRDLHFGIFHGLSANRRRRLDLTDTMQMLDYVPLDDAFALAEKNGHRIIQRGRTKVRRAVSRLWSTT